MSLSMLIMIKFDKRSVTLALDLEFVFNRINAVCNWMDSSSTLHLFTLQIMSFREIIAVAMVPLSHNENLYLLEILCVCTYLSTMYVRCVFSNKPLEDWICKTVFRFVFTFKLNIKSLMFAYSLAIIQYYPF